MPEHVHVHAPPELAESHASSANRERILELVAVVLLSIATIAVAWSGYQAAQWSGVQSQRYAQASTARSLANRAETLATQERLQDLLNFNRWLEVSTNGNEQLAALYERRFRPEFRPAFEAWQAQNRQDATAVPSPLAMQEYRLADAERSASLEAIGDRRFGEAKAATEHAEEFIFTTVSFATVMFFAGISLRFQWVAMRVAVLGVATVLLGYGLVGLATKPSP